MASQLPPELSVALKEWAIVVDALERGEQTILLRKGGLTERAGRFEVEHPVFALYPTTEHQRREHVKERTRPRLASGPEEKVAGGHICFASAARITDIRTIDDLSVLDALADQHVLAADAVEQRWRYKPERPFVLLVLRTYLLAPPFVTPFVPRYEGCRSWVVLETPVAVLEATAVLSDAAFEERRRLILGT